MGSTKNGCRFRCLSQQSSRRASASVDGKAAYIMGWHGHKKSPIRVRALTDARATKTNFDEISTAKVQQFFGMSIVDTPKKQQYV